MAIHTAPHRQANPNRATTQAAIAFTITTGRACCASNRRGDSRIMPIKKRLASANEEKYSGPQNLNAQYVTCRATDPFRLAAGPIGSPHPAHRPDDPSVSSPHMGQTIFATGIMPPMICRRKAGRTSARVESLFRQAMNECDRAPLRLSRRDCAVQTGVGRRRRPTPGTRSTKHRIL